jgi:hypothetical protein
MTTTETINKLQQVPTGVWYSVTNKSGVSMVELIKELIDQQQHFELSDCYTRFKRLEDYFSPPN